MIHTLEADGINLGFDLPVILSDVYLRCETSKITGLLGRNGQGKSCLMNIMLGNLKTRNSSVCFDQRPVAHANQRPDLLLYLPQFNFVPATLKVRHVLDDFRLPAEDFETWFPEFRSRYDQRVGSLSGGQRRLLEIYVIIKAPSWFAMLDEPFTHLHPVQVDRVKEFLRVEKYKKAFY